MIPVPQCFHNSCLAACIERIDLQYSMGYSGSPMRLAYFEWAHYYLFVFNENGSYHMDMELLILVARKTVLVTGSSGRLGHVIIKTPAPCCGMVLMDVINLMHDESAHGTRFINGYIP